MSGIQTTEGIRLVGTSTGDFIIYSPKKKVVKHGMTS